MALREWRDILDLVESDKIKDRVDGVSRVRGFLSLRANFNSLCSDPKHNWIESLQRLFQLLVTERNSHAVKATSTGAKRVEEAATAVAWVAEKVHLKLNRKGIKALLNHFVQTVAIRSKLQPYALTYLRALRAILSYSPHLEHLDERQWTDIVTLCFSGILGDQIKLGEELYEEEVMQVDDKDIDSDDSNSDDDQLSTSTSKNNKRLGKALRETPSDRLPSLPPTSKKRTANQVEIELALCLEAAFRSKSTPFLLYSRAIFIKFTRFLSLFPIETTAHIPIVGALNLALGELDLNDQKSMKEVATGLWEPIVGLWGTKSPSMKENVLMALRYLLPFAIPMGRRDATVEARARSLWETVLGETTSRWRHQFELDVDHLRLGLVRGEDGEGIGEDEDGVDEETEKAFHGKTFRIGHGFSSSHVAGWTLMELGADALARVHGLAPDSLSAAEKLGSPEKGGKNKRRKVEEPLAAFIDSLDDDGAPAPTTIYRLQLVLFLIERHWSALPFSICHRLLSTLSSIISQNVADAHIQNWASLAVAAIAHSEFPLEPEQPVSTLLKPRKAATAIDWDHLWTLLVRRISNPDTSRCASHAASILLAHDRVNPAAISSSIESLSHDLGYQGPSFPSDGVCTFLEWTLALATTDVRLYRLQLKDKVLNWLLSSWKPLDGVARVHTFGQQRPRADPFSPSHLVGLLARLCDVEKTPKMVEEVPVPDCQLGTMAIEHQETSKLRDFVEGKVPKYRSEPGKRKATSTTTIRTPSSVATTSGAPEDVEHRTERRLLAWLQRTLDSLLEDGEHGGQGYWDLMSIELSRRHLDLASLSLVIVGLFDAHQLRENRTTIKSAAEVLTLVAPTLGNPKWSPSERAHLLAALSPLFVPLPDHPAVPYPVLLNPGSASGLPYHLIPDRRPQHHQINYESFEFKLLRTIWKQPTTQKVLIEIISVLDSILRGVTNEPSSTNSSDPSQAQPSSTQATQRLRNLEQTQRDDDFGEVKVAAKAAQLVGSVSTIRAGSSVMSGCIRGIVSGEMAQSGTTGSVRVVSIVEAIINADGNEAIVITEQALNAVQVGLVTFGLSSCENVLQHLGGVLLPNYRFARDERFALLGLRFLEATASTWIRTNDSEASADFGDNARELCAWYVASLQRKVLASWRVRLRFIAFLDTYLDIDNTSEWWDKNGSAFRDSNDEVILPTAIIPSMLQDVDFRVRFRAATSAPQLFTFMYENGLDSAPLFHDISNLLEHNLVEVERILTQSLCHANIMIVSAQRRNASYELLLYSSSKSPEYVPQTVACLRGVAQRLCFNGLDDLYLSYARYLLFVRNRREDAATLTLSHVVCGFPTQRAMCEADFRSTGSFALQSDGGLDKFQTTCAIIKQTPQQTRLDCLAETIALTVVRAVVAHDEDTATPRDGRYTTAGAQMAAMAAEAGAGDQHLITKLITSMADDIVAEILSLQSERIWSSHVVTTLDLDTKSLATLQSIFDFSVQYHVDFSPPPRYRAVNVVHTCRWFDKQIPVFNDPAAIFSILHKLLARLHEARLVATQQQTIFSIALVLSLAPRACKDSTILGALVESLVVLLSQGAIAPLVAGMLRWCFSEWLKLNHPGPPPSGDDLCANAVKAAYASQNLINSAKTGTEAEVGSQLGHFLADVIHALEQRNEPTVLAASLLWPWPLIDSAQFELGQIQGVLSSSFAPRTKFSVVQSLRERQDFAGSPHHGLVLWRLLDAITPSSDLTAEDCIALADLLFEGAAQVDPPGLDQFDSRQTTQIRDEKGVKAVVVKEVLECLHSDDRKLVHQAYTTAKAIFSSVDSVYDPDELSRRSLGAATFLSSASLLRPDRIRTRKPRTLDELDDGKWVEAAQDHPTWIRHLGSLLADIRAEGDPFYAQLVPLLSTHSSFAARAFPHLVHSILIQGDSVSDDSNRRALSSYFGKLLRAKSTSKEALASMVNVAVYLRRHPRPDFVESLSSGDQWLSLSWVLLAEGAVKTSAYLTALLFLELAAEYDGLFSKDKDDRKLDARGQALLYDIYGEIDEPDGFYGRQSPDVREALVRRFHHESRWSEAFGVHGADFESQTRGRHDQLRSGPPPTAGVVQSLASFGFNRLAMSVLQPARVDGTIGDSDLPLGLSHELAWRTSTWDLPIEKRAQSTSSVALYSALRSAHAGRDVSELQSVASSALVSEVGKLASVSIDLPRPNVDVLSAILALREVHRLSTLKAGEQLDESLVTDLHLVPSTLSFGHADRILSTRISLLRSIRAQEETNVVGEFSSNLYRETSAKERACLVSLSGVARRSGHLQASMNAITLANKLVDVGTSENEVDEEFAQVLWQQGEHGTAIQLLEAVSHRGTSKKALVWSRLGEWKAEARLRSAREILEGSFEPATIELKADQGYTASERASVFASFASFADSQYQENLRSTNERRTRFLAYRSRKESELNEISRQLEEYSSGTNSGGLNTHDLQRVKTMGRAHLEEDRRLLEDAEHTTARMCWLALENYAKSLTEADTHDHLLLRFIALWLEHSTDEEVNTKLKPLLASIPSHKFVFLAYQLSARLAKPASSTPFSKNILKLVLRLCTDHPFHSLYPVNALRDVSTTGKSKKSATGRSRRSSTMPESTQPANMSRAKASEEIFDKLKNNPNMSTRVNEIETVCAAYREWADHDIRTPPFLNPGSNRTVKKGDLPIPSGSELMTKVQHLSIPVTTFDLPVDPLCRYDSSTFPAIVKYRSTFRNAGGVNMPKIVKCCGSDGKEYTQLLKGNDDIRQDAVMEQVFTLVNSLLQRDEQTRRRKLLIRTYKVVPLQNATGIIQFVDNTQPLIDVLTPLYESLDKSKLRPKEARAKLANVSRGQTKEEELLNKDAMFEEILTKMPPMMRHVFFHRHKLPSFWFDMRLSYSRSVATTSIIGHVLGLGDRHVSNILMDKVRGELIAIDLGIAFDQGKRLPIPETVPFRLTQNIVDGFGHSGVEGVFRRCAEETLRVLRTRSNVVLTVLEVLKHDPLQSWALSAEMVKRVQGSDEGDATSVQDTPDDADRAFAIVAAKLDTKLSVEYKVNQLIIEAMDHTNLARIFVGWQSFL